MSEPIPPLCCECKHFREPIGPVHAPKPTCAALRDVVYGGPLSMDCYSVRGDQLLCGISGRYWEPRMNDRMTKETTDAV